MSTQSQHSKLYLHAQDLTVFLKIECVESAGWAVKSHLNDLTKTHAGPRPAQKSDDGFPKCDQLADWSSSCGPGGSKQQIRGKKSTRMWGDGEKKKLTYFGNLRFNEWAERGFFSLRKNRRLDRLGELFISTKRADGIILTACGAIASRRPIRHNYFTYLVKSDSFMKV